MIDANQEKYKQSITIIMGIIISISLITEGVRILVQHVIKQSRLSTHHCGFVPIAIRIESAIRLCKKLSSIAIATMSPPVNIMVLSWGERSKPRKLPNVKM